METVYRYHIYRLIRFPVLKGFKYLYYENDRKFDEFILSNYFLCRLRRECDIVDAHKTQPDTQTRLRSLADLP